MLYFKFLKYLHLLCVTMDRSSPRSSLLMSSRWNVMNSTASFHCQDIVAKGGSADDLTTTRCCKILGTPSRSGYRSRNITIRLMIS
jgi:hypothetical protein